MESLLLNGGIVALLLLIYVTTVFLIAQLKADNSVMDIAYGPAFLVAAAGAVWLTGTTALLPLAMVGAIALWATRLSSRILRKNWGKSEDARYAAWRERWLENGRLYFIIRSYLQVNVLQGLIIFVVLTPFTLALTFADATPHWPTLILGGLVFVLGLSLETIADWQLDQFIARKKAGTESATLMTKGLFRFSRRPNYFGESLIWWGLALAALPLPYGWLALASPLLITFILTRVTGPMLEDIFLEKYPDEYRAYMARTSYFIPLPPRTPHSYETANDAS